MPDALEGEEITTPTSVDLRLAKEGAQTQHLESFIGNSSLTDKG